MAHEMGVYQITCLKTDHRYVGSTNDLFHRKAQHFSDLKLGRHRNPRMQEEYNTYGYHSFRFIVLEKVEATDFLLQREQYWINQILPEYNAELKAGHTYEHVYREDVKQKISSSMKKIWLNPEYKQNYINKRKGVPVPKLKGRVFSDETRQKIREAGSGEKNHNYGKPRCQSFMDKISKTWEGLISPDGVPQPPIKNMNAFCRENNLDSGQMSKLLSGKAKSCKGWTKV